MRNISNLRKLNIKTYEIIYEVDVPLIEMAYAYYWNEMRGWWEQKSWGILNFFEYGNAIRIEYGEYESHEIIDDPISGAGHNEYILLNKFYYDVDKNTGTMVDKGKYD